MRTYIVVIDKENQGENNGFFNLKEEIEVVAVGLNLTENGILVFFSAPGVECAAFNKNEWSRFFEKSA